MCRSMAYSVALVFTTTLLSAPVSSQVPSQVQITVEAANLRSGSGTNHPIIAVIPGGTVLQVAAAQGDWYRVLLTPEYGVSATSAFIHRSLVQATSVDLIAVPGPAATVPPAAAEARFQYSAGGPCEDANYIALKRRDVDSLSPREFELFQTLNRNCFESREGFETRDQWDRMADRGYSWMKWGLIVSGVGMLVSLVMIGGM